MKESQPIKQIDIKERVVRGAYGADVILPENKLVKDFPLAGHGLNECGRHYNIFEEDDGFPQERFYPKQETDNPSVE